MNENKELVSKCFLFSVFLLLLLAHVPITHNNNLLQMKNFLKQTNTFSVAVLRCWCVQQLSQWYLSHYYYYSRRHSRCMNAIVLHSFFFMPSFSFLFLFELFLIHFSSALPLSLSRPPQHTIWSPQTIILSTACVKSLFRFEGAGRSTCIYLSTNTNSLIHDCPVDYFLFINKSNFIVSKLNPFLSCWCKLKFRIKLNYTGKKKIKSTRY